MLTTMSLQGFGGNAMAPPPNPTMKPILQMREEIKATKSGPNPSGNANEPNLTTTADASVAASGTSNDTSASKEPALPTLGHANYGRNTEEDEEIQEGWGHEDNIPDIGTNGTNITMSLASNFPMAVMDDKKKINRSPNDPLICQWRINPNQ